MMTTISIHALRVEGDRRHVSKHRRRVYFYPRPPGGGRRPFLSAALQGTKGFLSTPSGWRATKAGTRPLSLAKISIHALRVEGDSRHPLWVAVLDNFYPRPPGGGRHLRGGGWLPEIKFLSTPSGWRATGRQVVGLGTKTYFYPRPPGGGRPIPFRCAPRHQRISIHALRVEGDHRQLDL